MKRWVTGDCHFYHKNIIKYCGRPDNHTELIVENLRGVVRKEDVIYFLGDVHFGTEAQLRDILCSIKGRKYLIRGNHDRWTDTKYLLCGFSGVFDALSVANFYMTHQPVIHHNNMINLHGHLHNLGYDNVKMFKQSYKQHFDSMHRLYSPEIENYQPRVLESFS